MTEFAATARGVTKRFGRTLALDDVGIEIRAGESHALVGRNGAGKSTLVSILTGMQVPDAGEVSFFGEPAPPVADRAAWRRHVACVYQKSTVVPELSVAENLFINRQDLGGGTFGGLISWKKLKREATELLETYDVAVNPDELVSALTVEQRQLVEIARALSIGSRFVILDEPTAQLDGPAIERLFDRMRSLQDKGVTFLFISHHLQEVYEVCQTVTVYRDARHIVTAPVAEMSKPDLIEAMTGEAGGLNVPSGADRPSSEELVLSVSSLSGESFSDISLSATRGEVIGLAGSASSGKHEFAETVYGLRKPLSGTISVDGTEVRGGDVPAALKAGIGCVPRDRHHQGLVLDLSIAENATMSTASRFVWPSAQRAAGSTAIASYDVKAAGPDQPVSDLSGGNQQKVVMARALAGDPSVLVLINPTAGVDVKSKESLLGVVDAQARRGKAAIVVSDELDDLRVCDRVLVMFHGSVVREFSRGWRDQELIAAIEGMSSE
ncbi:sugar ABC transporter ATP-binding protein [Lentzea flava]|uniref:Multidrug ABC transporter ATP-binding protein n=1 Tax=Lentzea flava TaxID=103732 RepID=A0ABQ2V880_9PSEU|nr:sugar ABC transporter ATP-binding protein [Lentzea flava]MCP2203967.1 simple sugar transport system ATP-binding protein [Lentzea flava]GGU73308.1 multidrug ABC transporter ATP-binding protein [Lentzea flava]